MKRFAWSIIILICFAWIFISCSKKDVKVVKIAGSTTIEPIARKAADILYKRKNISLEILANGSHKGIDLLNNGLCDIAESSVRISDHEKGLAAAKGVVIQEFAIAQDLIVPIVHKENTINDLSIGDLRDIYTGRERSWKGYGWNKETILPVCRGKLSGTGEIWNMVVLKSHSLSSSVIVKNSNSSVLAYVSENKGAIGYISYGFINSDVKTLSINGVKANISKGTDIDYPLVRKLYLYGNGSTMTDAARSFIVFLLSNEGQKIISQEGFIPLGYDE